MTPPLSSCCTSDHALACEMNYSGPLFQVYLWETRLRDLNDQHDCEWRGVLQPGGGAPCSQDHEGEQQQKPCPQGLPSFHSMIIHFSLLSKTVYSGDFPDDKVLFG